MSYQSPFGKTDGLATRLASWISRMSGDRSLPWVGLGLIYDLRCVMRLLTLPEFAEWLHLHPDGDLAQWAGPIREAIAASDELDALQDKIDDQPGPHDEAAEEAYDESVERLGDEAKELANVRAELVRLGVLADDDVATRPSQLLGLLFQ